MRKLCKIKDTDKIAQKIAKEISCAGSAVSGATIIGLHGDLGSGKTTFVKAFAKALGIKETVLSPTYVLIKSYKLKAKSYKLLIHIDVYRLDSADELLALGWNELISNPENLILIEWPERVKKILPKSAREIKFKFIDDKTRLIQLKD